MTSARRCSASKHATPKAPFVLRTIRWLVATALCLAGWACATHNPALSNQPRAAVPELAPSSRLAPVDAAPSPGFSWSVVGTRTVITLVGSIHIGFDGLYPLPDPVESAFRESTVLAMELALDQEPPERVAELMIDGAMLPKGQTLHDCLSEKTWLQYQSFAKDHVDQATFLDRFRPWFVAVFLVGEQATLDGYDANQGIDLHFFNQRGSRKVVGLESAEQQIKALANLPAATQDLMLAEQLEAMNHADDGHEALARYWKKGDAAGLARELFDQYDNPKYAPVYDALIAQRNVRMTRQIEQWLEGSERIFVVLGAGHFIGNDGIIARLQRDGWMPHRL